MDKIGDQQKHKEGRIGQHLHTDGTPVNDQAMNYVSEGSMYEHDYAGQHDKMSIYGNSMVEGRNQMSHMGHMQMHTTFSLKTYSDFLFEGVKISTVQGTIWAVVFTIIISILFDSLKYMMHVREKHLLERLKTKARDQKINRGQCITTLYHMMSITVAYIMMLCVMTMNIWLMISVVLGSGIGHLVMRPFLSWKLGKLEHFPEYKTKQTTIEETKPLSDYHIDTGDGDDCDECSKDANTDTV